MFKKLYKSYLYTSITNHVTSTHNCLFTYWMTLVYSTFKCIRVKTLQQQLLWNPMYLMLNPRTAVLNLEPWISGTWSDRWERLCKAGQCICRVHHIHTRIYAAARSPANAFNISWRSLKHSPIKSPPGTAGDAPAWYR